MNYEKAYKEALERASHIKDNNTVATPQEVAEFLFPELLESEDDRIKRCIQVALTDVDEKRFNDYGISLKDCLAWLEKQGEKSVCKVKIGETYKCIASPRYTCFRTGDIYHVTDNFVAELISTCSDCFVLLEKQGENTYDYKRVNLDKFDDRIRDFSDVLEDKPKPYWDGWYEAMEWVRTHGNPFEKQGEKSWSEEDERMLKSIIYCIDGTALLDSDQIDWLKSLKPNRWKPTEEQMEALETTIHISNFGLDIDRLRMLESLYNDLKSFL